MQLSDNGIPIYVLQDGNLNVVGLTDAAGNLARQYSFSPYGELAATETFLTAPDNAIGFQGMFVHRYDADTSTNMLIPDKDVLYLTPNRTYAPKLGRWLQKDTDETGLQLLAVYARNAQTLRSWPVTIAADALYGDGMNLYQYVVSNPISRRDPLGLFVLPDIGTANTEGAYIDASHARNVSLAQGLIMLSLGIIATDMQWGMFGGFTSDAASMFVEGTEAWMSGAYAYGENMMQMAEVMAVITVFAMADMSQSDAVEKAISWRERIIEHWSAIATGGPGNQGNNHWRGEIKAWLDSIERLVKRMKGKTAEKWANWVRDARRALEELLEGRGPGSPPPMPG